jgi:small subunit ribosomal protein S18
MAEINTEKKVRTTGTRAPKVDGERSGAIDEGRNEGRGDGMGSWRRRPRPAVDLVFDYKQIETIAPFLGEDGRIVPARVSRLSRKQQRKLTAEIKRARHLALIPVSSRHLSLNKMTDVRPER